MLRMAHGVGKEANGNMINVLLAIKCVRRKRKAVREMYWQEFAQNVGNVKSLKEIWYQVNKARSKTNTSLATQHPEAVATNIQKRAKASLVSLPRSTRDGLEW